MANPIEIVKWALPNHFYDIDAVCEFKFGTSNQNGQRRSGVRANNFASRKYNGEVEVMSIEIDTQDFIIFRHRSISLADRDPAGRVVLSYPHMAQFTQGLKEVADLFQGVDVVFKSDSTDPEMVVVADEYIDQQFAIEGLYNGAVLLFQPIVIAYQPREGEVDGSETFVSATKGAAGVRMFLNGLSYSSDAPLEHFLSFVRFYCSEFNLFAMSQAAAQIAVTVASSNGTLDPRSAPVAPQPRRVSPLGTPAASRPTIIKTAR